MARTRYRSSSAPTPWQGLPAAALRAVIREGYTGSDFRHDLLAGTVVGIVALPLSMALAIAVGAPPQAGLYTAIVAGFVVALLGGSRTQVTGPTAAFVVILAPIYARFGLPGLLVSGLLAGVILVAMGLFRLGRFIEFIPYPVTTGFTAGIGTVIAVLQVKDLFGLKLEGNPEQFIERVWAMANALPSLSLPEMTIGLMTLACLLVWPKMVRKVPAALVALPLAVGLSRLALGVHWLTDVAGGALLGLGWVLLLAALLVPARERGDAAEAYGGRTGRPRAPYREERAWDSRSSTSRSPGGTETP